MSHLAGVGDLQALAVHEIGVRLTDCCLMAPKKSITFVMGMGPNMRPDAVACDFCSKRERGPWRVGAQVLG